MKTKLLFTILGIFLMATYQVFSSIPTGLNQEMPSETQLANGKVLTVKVQSQAIANNLLGDSETRKVSVFLPPGYDENGNKNYPVIYMLSDYNGTNEDWFQAFGESYLPDILDKMIKSGKIKPVIMVFPDGKNKFGGSWYTNSVVSGNWEDFVVNDLVNYVDQNFRTLPFAASRGIAGKGMGGFGALKLATQHPDIFSNVYALNALVDLKTVVADQYIWGSSFGNAIQATEFPTVDAFANQLLSMAVAFAPNQNNQAMGNLPKTETGETVNNVLEKWLQNDPLQLILSNTSNLKALKSLIVDCSSSSADIMLSSNYSQELGKVGINHSFKHFEGTENSVICKRVTEIMLPAFNDNLAHSLLVFDEKYCYTYSDVLKVSLITDGSIFVVPLNNDAPRLSMISEKVVNAGVRANSPVEIRLDGLSKGIYKIYGVSNTGFTGKSHLFGLNGGTPLVKICVTDSYTGEKIETCHMTVNDMVCKPNGDGEHCFNAEGAITICMEKQDYGKLTKSATIYTDTIITMSLVKNSLLQVVEKGINKPVFEATVTQSNQATLTGVDGYTTVYNVDNGILDCRIFKTGYFTEVVNQPLIPGQTAVVELTRKTADVEFILIGDPAQLQVLTVVLGENEAKADQTGRVKFSGVDNRKEHTWSVLSGSAVLEQGSVYLESNTIITVPLWQESDNSVTEMKLAEPESSLKSDKLITRNTENPDIELSVYPNPVKNSVTIQTNCVRGFTFELRSETGALLEKSKINGTLHRINMSNLSNGVYFVTVKSDNFYRTQRIMKL